eukprot:XP_011666810.1 PREDICTED: suppressor protein SRP40-like isoform X2 [Strongylocentrotus purpuratus]
MGSTDGPHSNSDMSGFQSLHSNDKAQRRNQNEATGGEGSSSSGSTDESHSNISGFHSLHSNEKPQKRTLGDIKSSQSSLMSQPGTLASTEDASYASDSNVTPGDNKSSQCSIMSRPGTLASTDDASYVKDPRVTVTLDPPVCEADTSNNAGSQGNQNGATEGEGASSSGSTDGSHSDISGFHSLHSNNRAQRRSSPDGSPRRDLLKPDSLSIKDVMAFALTGRTLSTESSNSDMSGCHSLHSNDEVEGRTSGDTKSSQSNIMSQPGTLASTENASYAKDSKVTPPMAALRSEKGTSSDSDDFSKPATLASTESAPCDDAPQSPQFLRSLSEVGSSSEISNWHSLHSTDRTPRRPQLLRSLSEVGGSSKISNWHSLRSTDRTPRRRRLHST